MTPTTSTLKLWPGPAPLAIGDTDPDVPTLTLHTPATPGDGRGAVLVCPGGGYGHLAPHEGAAVGASLAAQGIFAAVLKYRIAPRYQHPAPLLDVTRAMRTLRAGAAALGIASNRIAVQGFSAGGHLASTLCVRNDAGNPDDADPVERMSCRPDRAVLCYPVISLEDAVGHSGSRRNLLGEAGAADAEQVKALSNHLHVNANTPPTFLFHTSDDPAVPVENALLYALALRRAGVDVELHAFEKGRHGVGLAQDDPRLRHWWELAVEWLRAAGW